MKMTWSDKLLLAMRNISRNKVRTLLTLLGVVVGCCAIVITISLGIAMTANQEKMLGQMGDLTVIEVYNYGRSQDGKPLKLKNEELTQIATLPHVISATPSKNSLEGMELKIFAGSSNKYQVSWVNFRAMHAASMEQFGFITDEGSFHDLQKKTQKIPVLVGPQLAYEFQNVKQKKNNMVSSETDANGHFLHQPFVRIHHDKMYLVASSVVGGKERTFRRELEVVGVLKGDMAKGYETVSGFLVDLERMNQFEKEAARALHVKHNTRDAKGYQEVKVKVAEISQVEAVQQAIDAMGYQTSSMDEIRRSMERDTRDRQVTLGGLAVTSLLVAAIGIANTMLMSVKERKKEIGIMKVIGFELKDILQMFLLEAGLIGLIGGIIGIMISYLISAAMNLFASDLLIQTGMSVDLTMIWQVLVHPPAPMSLIPYWLSIISLLFAVGIGILSGTYPAFQAVRVSVMEAMRQ